jgi:hypothetical protein
MPDGTIRALAMNASRLSQVDELLNLHIEIAPLLLSSHRNTCDWENVSRPAVIGYWTLVVVGGGAWALWLTTPAAPELSSRSILLFSLN